MFGSVSCVRNEPCVVRDSRPQPRLPQHPCPLPALTAHPLHTAQPAVLQRTARNVESEGVLGSSTICLLTINMKQGLLHSANLGDSGFLLLGYPRDGNTLEVKYRTTQLEHEFGRPFQLGHHQHADKPANAELATLQLSKGDIIVMGSDGLLDNISDTEIVQVRRRLAVATRQQSSSLLAFALFGSGNRFDAEPCRLTGRDPGHMNLF